MTKKLPWIVVAIVVVVLGAISGVSVVKWKHDRDEKNKLHPLTEAAATFPVPQGAQKSLDDMTTTAPPRLIRSWSDPNSLETACSHWGNAFRAWIGEDKALGSVTGEVTPGQTCEYEGRKDGIQAKLLLAGYQGAAPQVILTFGAR